MENFDSEMVLHGKGRKVDRGGKDDRRKGRLVSMSTACTTSFLYKRKDVAWKFDVDGVGNTGNVKSDTKNGCRRQRSNAIIVAELVEDVVELFIPKVGVTSGNIEEVCIALDLTNSETENKKSAGFRGGHCLRKLILHSCLDIERGSNNSKGYVWTRR